MILSLKNTITNTFYVFGVEDLPSGLCIEEQNTINKLTDGKLEEYYEYYIYETCSECKMFMYGTGKKCFPTEEQIVEYYKYYKDNYLDN